MPLQAVIFDMDGLMFDTESAYSVVQVAMSSKRGKVFTNEVKRSLMGKRASEVMGLLNNFWGNHESIEDLLKEQDEQLLQLYEKSVTKLPGLDALLAFLNGNHIRKCIGTSSRKTLVDVLLKKFGLESEFEFVVSGEMVQRGKPDPEIYLQCLSKLSLNGQHCLVLEDSLNGVRAAIAAGCRACAIPSEYTKEEDFSSASIIATSLADTTIRDYLVAQI